MNKNVIISKLNIDHLKQIIFIENNCYDLPWTKEHFLFEINNEISCSFVLLYKKSKVLGFLIAHKIFDQMNILNLTINKEHQGIGFGKMLLDHSIKFAKKNCIKKINLEVRKENSTAQMLYSGRNFKIAEEKENYYSNGDSVVIMYRDIHF